jgi:hypothetical protein
MHYGSGAGAGFGSRSHIKIKIKNERPTFWEIMLLMILKRQNFLQIFMLWKNFSKVGTGTAISLLFHNTVSGEPEVFGVT